MRRVSSERAPPDGLVVFHIDCGDAMLALFCYEVAPSGALAKLSNAERAVMAAIFVGKSNAQIAAERRTAPRTVANQVARIFRKLGVRSRAELVARYPLAP